MFEKLSVQENEDLLKFPAYISILAADSDEKLNDNEKKSASRLSYTNTFSCDPLLAEYYEETNKIFDFTIIQLDKNLPKEKELRKATIEKELLKLETIIMKLGKKYASIMHKSMKSFEVHVFETRQKVLDPVFFPAYVPGL